MALAREIPLASRCTFISELFERADAGSALSRESRLPPALADCYQITCGPAATRPKPPVALGR